MAAAAGSGQQARTRLAAREAEGSADPTPVDAVTVRQAVAALRERQRTALVLRYYADLPVAEVAALMGAAPRGR